MYYSEFYARFHDEFHSEIQPEESDNKEQPIIETAETYQNEEIRNTASDNQNHIQNNCRDFFMCIDLCGLIACCCSILT